MKINLLFALCMLFLFSGCSLNDKDPEPEKTYLLQRKYSETISNGLRSTIDLTYTYNNNNQLINISGVANWKGELKTIYTKLAYDSKGRVTRINTLSGTEWILYHNDKDQLEKVTRTYFDSLIGIYMYYYDDKGRLSEMKNYVRAVSVENLSDYRVFSYPGANQIKIAIYVGNERTSEYTLLTDNKKRNLPALPHQISFEFFSEELMTEGLISQHNIVSLEQLNFNRTTGASNKSGTSYQTEFTYNDSGYPLTGMRTFHEGSVQKVTYTYSTR